MTKTPAQRFFAKVDRTDSCWLWTGALQPEGYGRFAPGDTLRRSLAHRWSYEFHVGPIPEGLTIDHLCRVRACVNPAHLEPVTLEENARRGNRNVDKPRCIRGHEFTPENTYSPPSRPQIRDCKTCRQVRRVEYRARRAAA